MDAVIKSHAGRFGQLQFELLSRFSEKFPAAHEDLFFSVPKRGELVVGNRTWTFQKHGLGVRFKDSSGGAIVDIHRFYAGTRNPVDAWRFLQYLESVRMEGLTEHGVDASLRELLREGLIRETAHANVYEMGEY